MKDTTLGSRLMDLRKTRQMSMRDLAKRSGASTSFISQVETGKTNPTVAKLQNLATALGVPSVKARCARCWSTGPDATRAGPASCTEPQPAHRRRGRA